MDTPATARGEAGSSVLVVEDDAPTRALLGNILAHAGIAHCLASDGPEAMQLCMESAPGMVVLDLQLPHMAGELVAEQLRRDFGPDLPILAISASNDEAAAQRVSAYAFLPKPFARSRFRALIQRGLQLAERSQH